MDDIENQKTQTKEFIGSKDKMNEDLRLSQKSLNYQESEQKTEREGGADEETEPLVSGYKTERTDEKKKKKKSRRSTKG